MDISEPVDVSELIEQLTKGLLTFPDITYEQFLAIQAKDPWLAEEILALNRIVNTDTYNRTMNFLLKKVPVEDTADSERSDGGFEMGTSLATTEATYALQLRRAPYGFLQVCGVERSVERINRFPVTQVELDFAIAHYKHTNVKYFDVEMWRWLVEENGGRFPFEIRGGKDGTIYVPGEVVLTYHGPSELLAVFEAQIHRIFRETLIATKARVLREILGDSSRFIEVASRSALTNAIHYRDIRAMYVGGGFRFTSNDAASLLYPTIDAGTLGHRYVQMFGSVEAAFRHAIENTEAVSLLVDLVDSIQGIDLGFDLKQEYRESRPDTKIWMRLDSGVIKDQVRHFLTKADELGFTDPDYDKVVVEGIDSLADIIEIEEMIENEFGEAHKQRVMYGAGGLMVALQTSRSDASSGWKIAEFLKKMSSRLVPCNKFADVEGKESRPGYPRMVLVDGKRVLAQDGETFGDSNVEELFSLFFDGETLAPASTEEEVKARGDAQFKALCQLLVDEGHPPFDPKTADGETFLKVRAKSSPETTRKQAEVRKRYGLEPRTVA